MLIAFENGEPNHSQEEQRRRRAVWEQLRTLQARVAARNTDLNEDEIEALADEVSREAIAALVNQGKVRFVR